MCVSKIREIWTICVMALEETSLPSATVRSQGCCNGVNFNPCNCANEKSMNDAVAPQSAMVMVLNEEVSLLAIIHDKTIWSHSSLLAMRALADIDNSLPSGL